MTNSDQNRISDDQHNNAPAVPVAWWIPKAEQFCLAKPSGERPFAKAWEPLYAAAPAVPQGWKLVPVEPTEAQWGELARDIMLAFDMSCKSPALLLNFLKNVGREIPQWLLDEVRDPASTHVLSKGTRAVIIYRAMLAATPSPAPIDDRQRDFLINLDSYLRHLECVGASVALVSELRKLEGKPAPAPAQEVGLTDEQADAVSMALRRAWQLGQTYWQQADSDYISQHKKSEETQRKFEKLCDDTIAALRAKGASDA